MDHYKTILDLSKAIDTVSRGDLQKIKALFVCTDKLIALVGRFLLGYKL